MKRILHKAIILIAMFAASGSFGNLMADDRIEVAASECYATPVNGGIKLAAESETTFDIYSITGQRIKSITVESEPAKVDLPKGCYIVRCSQWSKKVIVK